VKMGEADAPVPEFLSPLLRGGNWGPLEGMDSPPGSGSQLQNLEKTRRVRSSLPLPAEVQMGWGKPEKNFRNPCERSLGSPSVVQLGPILKKSSTDGGKWGT